MYNWERKLRDDPYRREKKNSHPSFSSSLLDEIYRSTSNDDGVTKSPDLKFYRQTMLKQQAKNGFRSDGAIEKEHFSSLHRGFWIEKWMEKKVIEKAINKQRQFLTEYERKSHQDHDHDQDVLCFSSTSISSDSSYGGFSSSDTDSFYGSRTRSSSFVRPERTRTIISTQAEKTKKTERPLFYEPRESHMLDDYHYNSATKHTPKVEEKLIKSKSKALKFYSNLKKIKQPISPGGRLASFINSLFTAGNAKKSRSSSTINENFYDLNSERNSNSGQVSTCSSASSFSRSCLIKNSPSTRERLHNGVKRSVRFYPVSVIVDEDSRPCGHKCLYEEPTTWKIGKSPSRRKEEELKFQGIERKERAGVVPREFLKYYHQNQGKTGLLMRDIRVNFEDDNNEDDDDAASCSSSDLFELDHLTVIGDNRYCEELPVYETTHVGTNHAIANGLII
ncbi:protein BIG GRAIN 1-like B [Mangifera indica]|uniref:protein BIG GRAIN 1-like B n=1 Tax=Mangifera indica TaxID=29780 RepID=UPI001CFBE69B|nr:protein BIG GRAIN 1-like B [Mangifera indica]